jgi:hypothetical protein
VILSNNLEDFSPQAESLGLMEKLEHLGCNRESTRVSFRLRSLSQALESHCRGAKIN